MKASTKTRRGATYSDTAEDMQWLRDTALRGYDVPAFGAAAWYGNDDCPLEIALFASNRPLVSDSPILTLVLTLGPDNLSTYQARNARRFLLLEDDPIGPFTTGAEAIDAMCR